jgi:uncharacterized metal-binding protein
MASGKAHATASILLTLPAGMLAFGLGGDWDAATACAVGSLAGVVLSPDLDVDDPTHSNYIVGKYLGCIGAAAWFAFWWAYAKFIPHRSPLSHWPVLGTLLRLLYIVVLSAPIWFLITLFLFGSGESLPTPGPALEKWLWWAILGLMLSDTMHYIMDYLPVFRQHRRPWWRRMLRRIF